ncbi:hypothetical protein [Xanthomonas translucens]|uniref:hypothetical protein n=2 Tax=Xanthomonas campestris pv. translucens TaxID=343 RepID=UPI0013E8CB34|nr:hypothetical protein [Xanthomonas translucens]
MRARGLMIRRVIRERQWMLHSPEMPEWIAGLLFAMRERHQRPCFGAGLQSTVFCPKPHLRGIVRSRRSRCVRDAQEGGIRTRRRGVSGFSGVFFGFFNEYRMFCTPD